MGEAHDHNAQMADPRLARAIEADMRRRFWWSLALTVPAVLYSPLGFNLLGLRLPAPIPVTWILFLLTTQVVFWTGSIFVTGASHSLRRRVPEHISADQHGRTGRVHLQCDHHLAGG